MISLGIIGAGRIGKVHAQSIMNHITSARLKTIADPFMNEETEASLRVLGVSDCTKDYKKILNDPEIDAVLICSSTNTHADISLEAIAAGKHVFCEKPVSQDITKIRQVMEKLKGTKLKYQVGFNRRFDHNFEAVRAAVANGDVGDVHIVRITSRDPAPPPPEYAAVSGGMFLDMTIHDFDMVRYLSGSEVEEVFAVGSVTVNPEIGKAGDVDTGVITLKLANGATAVIDNCRAACYGYDQRAEVFGTEGAIAISNDSDSNAVFSGKDGVIAEKPMFFFLERYMAAYAREIDEFVEAIVNNTETPVNANDGLQPVLIGLAAKNAILIVEFAKVRVDRGMDPLKAAIQAAGLRLRPILMTSFAFIIGCLPLCMASGAGAAARNGMGVAVVGGMLFATILGIFLIPVFYVIVDRISRMLGLGKKAKTRTADDYM